MKYLEYISKNITESFEIDGRSSAQDYWRYFNLSVILTYGLFFIYSLISDGYPGRKIDLDAIFRAASFVIMIPLFGLSIRRMHDINKSAWWCLIDLTIIGIFLTTYWSIKKSDSNVNRYGDFPVDKITSNFHRNFGLILFLPWQFLKFIGLINLYLIETIYD